jgi:hypothetical protein
VEIPCPDVFWSVMIPAPLSVTSAPATPRFPCLRPAIARKLPLLFAALALSLALMPRSSQAADSARIHWTTVTEAQVKVDQTTPLTWSVYQAGKGDKLDKKLSSLVLVLVGHRYLLLDLKSKCVYEVPLTALHAQGGGFDSGDLISSSQLIRSSDWTSRNAGPAELYRLTLGDYGRVLQLTLPHPFLVSPYF